MSRKIVKSVVWRVLILP